MKKTNFTKIVKDVRTTVVKHSPEILTGIGIAGMITTTVLAVKATPKAIRLIDSFEKEKGEAITAGETIKTCWKCYIPATVTCVASVGCLIGASHVNARRNAALATAYKLSETALTEYREKVVETIGEKKEKAIKDKIAQDKVDKEPVSKKEIFITDSGTQLCFDVMSSRYFQSSIEDIKKAANELNRRLSTGENYVSLSDFYDEIGLSHTKNSDNLGWNIGKDGWVELDFSATISEDGRPCIVVDYLVAPRYDFWKESW